MHTFHDPKLKPRPKCKLSWYTYGKDNTPHAHHARLNLARQHASSHGAPTTINYLYAKLKQKPLSAHPTNLIIPCVSLTKVNELTKPTLDPLTLHYRAR